jgi:hypothetical protein
LLDDSKYVLFNAYAVAPSKRQRVKSVTLRPQPSYDALDLNIFGEYQSHKRARRRRFPLLKIFPCYDKCESLTRFPTAMVTHLNTGDFCSLSKLFGSHLHQDCKIMYKFFNLQMNGASLLRLFQFMNDLHPDSYMCVHHTKVSSTEIKATIHGKFTVCWKIHDTVVRMLTDPCQRKLLPMIADENLIKSLVGNARSQLEEDSVAALVRERKDIVVYAQIDLTLTIDDASKRVSAMCVDSWPTSVKAADVLY